METQAKQNRHIGKKIWYSFIIFISVLVLIISAVGAVGTWYVERSLSDAVVGVFEVVYQSAGGLRNVGTRLNQSGGEIRQISTNVSEVSKNISQNIADKGLIATLLPQEQEQNLTAKLGELQDSFNNIKDLVFAGINLYTAIDKLPFINLPMPSQEKIDQALAAITNIQTTADELRQTVQDFRQNASGEIGKVTAIADKVTQSIDELSVRLGELDSNLANLQAFAQKMQQILPNILFAAAIVLTLLFVYLIYSQVEMILLFIRRWKALGQETAELTTPAAVEPMEPGTGS